MPHILVKYNPNAATFRNEEAFKFLSGNLSFLGAKYLSVPNWILKEQDFSISYLPKGPHDRMTKDVEIVIFAHAFRERLDNVDVITEQIGKYVREALEDTDIVTSYSVSLILSSIGYYAGHIFEQ